MPVPTACLRFNKVQASRFGPLSCRPPAQLHVEAVSSSSAGTKYDTRCHRREGVQDLYTTLATDDDTARWLLS